MLCEAKGIQVHVGLLPFGFARQRNKHFIILLDISIEM